ncbi:MAG: hypothetical protein J6O41_00135 [Clostridia bacterium]|nr:hypothetical protein [Clostridia bacterium]
MILSIIFLIIIIVLGISIRKYNIENRRLQDIVNYYNSIDSNVVEKVDSIEYNIQVKDSIIYELKKKYIDEIEIVKANNDIDALGQFKELVSAE